MEKPHYEKKEQFMCVIDGQVDVITIPYIYRQEVYAGHSYGSPYDMAILGLLTEEQQLNVCPVNFFAPDL